MRIIIAIVVFFITQSAHAETITSDMINNYISKHGEDAAINKYFDCFDERAYSQIEKGSKDWIALAVKLLDHSDACVSESLHNSLAIALLHKPENVLPLVNSSARLSASQICLPFLSADEPAKEHLQYLAKLQRALDAVKDKSYDVGKNACIAEIARLRKILEQDIAEIARTKKILGQKQEQPDSSQSRCAAQDNERK